MTSPSEPEWFEDYYGTNLQPEPVMASPGPVVDINIDHGNREEFVRFLPADAIRFGEAIIAAAKARL